MSDDDDDANQIIIIRNEYDDRKSSRQKIKKTKQNWNLDLRIVNCKSFLYHFPHL